MPSPCRIFVLLATAGLIIGCTDGSDLQPAAPSLSADIGTLSWTTRAPLPVARTSAASVVVQTGQGPVIYLIGGLVNGQESGLVEVYDPRQNSWSARAPIPDPRFETNGAVFLAGKVYLIGGWHVADGSPTARPLEYTVETGTWRFIPGTALTGSGATVVIGSKLYTLTGTEGGGAAGLLDSYNPATGKWETLAPAPNGHMNPGWGVIDGKFYVAGGINDCCGTFGGSLDVYDPATNTWESKAPMPTPRWRVGSAVLAGKLYIFGGLDSLQQIQSLVEVYDPVTDTWSTGEPMTGARQGMGAAATLRHPSGMKVAFLMGGGDGTRVLRKNEMFFP